jgi:tetratricopeptide (TPR) repeat protein
MLVRTAAITSFLSLLAVGCARAPAPTPASPSTANGAADPDAAAANKRWHALTRAKKADEARALCTPWLTSPSKRLAAEGHKCLANVELIGGYKLQLPGTTEGGKEGALVGGYAGPGVDRAIDHLTQAIALAPDDLSAHQGRLHVAINSARVGNAPALLGDSLARYKGPDATEDWLSYSQELWEMRAGAVGLEYMRVLERFHPDDHRVAGNVGTFLISLKRDDEALPYLRRAVTLAPNDAIDNWNLGRFLEKHGDPAGAEPFYRKAVSLEKEPERRQDMACNLGRFLTARPATRAEGCALAYKECGGRIPECGTPPFAP